MRRALMIGLATVALGVAASPASAAVVVVGGQSGVPSCAAWSFTQNETKCAGGYEGNLLSSSPITGTGLGAIQALGYTGSGAFITKLDNLNNASTLNFGQTLFGLTIVGIHYGAAGAAPEATSFFLFDLGTTGASSIDITGRAGANALGTSNAVLFSTAPVPEPATWGMMLLGFAGIGMAVRRSRRRSGALMQIA